VVGAVHAVVERDPAILEFARALVVHEQVQVAPREVEFRRGTLQRCVDAHRAHLAVDLGDLLLEAERSQLTLLVAQFLLLLLPCFGLLLVGVGRLRRVRFRFLDRWSGARRGLGRLGRQRRTGGQQGEESCGK
jgi:hypothetical protein